MHQTERCENCGKEVQHPFETVRFGNGTPRLLCNACFNEEVAARAGIDFRHPEFSPIQLADAAGGIHTFHFATRLVDLARVSIEAYEPDVDPGYRFQVISGSAGNPRELHERLLGKIRRALVREHIVVDKQGFRRICDEMMVHGRFDWDENMDGAVPLLAIDGKPVTWEQLGRLLTTFEGWQFKLEIYDPSDER